MMSPLSKNWKHIYVHSKDLFALQINWGRSQIKGYKSKNLSWAIDSATHVVIKKDKLPKV